MFILAEVKVRDGDEWDVRLFNCSWEAFRSMANKRFVAVGRTTEVPDLPNFLARYIGWIE